MGEVSPHHGPCSEQLIRDPSLRFVVLQLKWDFNWGALSLAVQFMAQPMALRMLLVENTGTA